MKTMQTKQDAVAHLEAQLARGREILEAPIVGYADLVQMSAERAAWSLGNKKLLIELLGDASALARCVSQASGVEALGNAFLAEVQRFRQLTMSQLALLERMRLVMQQMA